VYAQPKLLILFSPLPLAEKISQLAFFMNKTEGTSEGLELSSSAFLTMKSLFKEYNGFL